MQGVRFGNSMNDHYGLDRSDQAVWSDEFSGVYTVFDSASPDILISAIWFDHFVDNFNATASY